MPLLMVCFEARIDIELFSKIVFALRFAPASASPLGTTSLTTPMQCVHRLGTIEDDDRHRTLALALCEFIGHRMSSGFLKRFLCRIARADCAAFNSAATTILCNIDFPEGDIHVR